MSNLIGISDDFERKFYGEYYDKYCELRQRVENAIFTGKMLGRVYIEELRLLSEAVLREKTAAEGFLFVLYREAGRLNNDYLDATCIFANISANGILNNLELMGKMGITAFALQKKAYDAIPQILSEGWVEEQGKTSIWVWDTKIGSSGRKESYARCFEARVFKKAE